MSEAIPDTLLARAFDLVEAMQSNKMDALTASETRYASMLTDDANVIARAIMAAAREADEAATKRERERCAEIANDLQYSADATFNDLTSRARKGEKHLELAAATAAGMSHQARKAAVTILKGEA